MKIDVQSYICHTYSENYEEHEIVWKILSYFIENVEFVNRSTGLNWSGETSIYIRDFHNGEFQTGLLEKVIEGCSKYKDFVLEIVDNRVFIEPYLDIGRVDISLRDYQEEAIKALTYEDKTPSFYKASCGSGKSYALIALFSKLKVRSLIVVPRVLLMKQLFSDYKKIIPDITIGRMGGGFCEYGCDLTIAVVNTIATKLKKQDPKMIDFVKNIECISSDEADISASDSYISIYSLAESSHRYGFSATPNQRSAYQNLLVEGIYGPIRSVTYGDDLMKQGLLSNVYVTFIPVNFPSTKATRGIRSKIEARDRLITYNAFRNKEICDVAKKITDIGKQPIIIFKYEKHGAEIEKVLKELYPDLKYRYMDGSTAVSKRDEIIDEYKNNEINVLVTSFIFSTGISINKIEYIIYAAAGAPKGELIQIMGRLTRYNIGKKAGILIDFDDNTNKVLMDDSEARKRTLLGERGYEYIPWESVIGS